MVVFTCQNCGEPVKKAQVEKHYYTKCRSKNIHLTCVDCLEDYFGQAYEAHTSCKTEFEKYSAVGTVIKEPTGKKKQIKYVEMIQNLLNSPNLTNVQRQLLDLCSNSANVPRKQKKFHNFLSNVGRSIKHTVQDEISVFQILEDAWKKETQLQAEDENSKTIGTSLNGDSVKENGDKHKELDEVNNSVGDSSESKKSKKKKKNKHESSADGEMLVDNNDCAEDTKENNVNGMSKKQLKKQKKYELYLAELEKEGSNNVDNNESIDVDHKKSKKKSKKSKNDQLQPDNTEVNSDKNTEAENTMEVDAEVKHKKSKKRKHNEDLNDTVEKKKKKEETEGEEVSEPQAVFDWADVIIRVLESQSDKELSLKKLCKKVVNEYQAVKQDHRTHEELLAKFNKKVKKTPGVRVLKDRAKLIQ